VEKSLDNGATHSVTDDEMTPDRLEAIAAMHILDNIEGALNDGCAALNVFILPAEDIDRIDAGVAKFAAALAQQRRPPAKNKRMGKQDLRARLHKIAAASNGILEPLNDQKPG
jgi:hypothetical protein